MRGVEDYLEEIKRLEEDDERITATVLARILEVSLPSASEMLKRLASEGYLQRAKGGAILLTPEGRRLAHTMLRRHRLVECLLVDKLGMAWYEVHGEAHKLEHAVSARVEEALAKALDYPDYCPHGHPICPIDLRRTERLTSLQPGGRGEVAQISELNEIVLPYLDQMGIRPGATLFVKDLAPLEGPMTVETDDGVASLGRELAALVRVTVDEGDAESPRRGRRENSESPRRGRRENSESPRRGRKDDAESPRRGRKDDAESPRRGRRENAA